MTQGAESARSVESRARLLDAATAAFAAKGFHATTTRDIAAAAGMSPAALYVHHKSKEELLYLIVKQGHELVLDAVQEALATSHDPSVRLMNAMRAFARLHAENRTVSRVSNYELGGLDPEHRAEVAAIRAGVVATFREIVEDGVRAGTFHSADPELTALVLLSLGIDLSRWYDDDRPWDADEVATYVSTAALHIVRAGDEPPARRASRRAGSKSA